MDYINKLLKSKNLKEEFLNELFILEAAIYSRLGEDEKALNIYENLKTKKIEDLHIIYHNIGRILTKLSRNEEGMKYLNEAIRIQLKLQSPETTMTLFHMGQLYGEQGNYKESAIYFENALINARQFNQLRELSGLYKSLLEVCVLLNSINSFEKYIDNLVNDIEKNIGKSRIAARLILILNNYLLTTSQIKRCIDLTDSLLKAPE
jgi:tetratricopeptide (TPR) repeat protein